MGRRQAPSKKEAEKVFSHLADNPTTSTGGMGRLAGKIARQLDIGIATVMGILEADERVVVVHHPDRSCTARLKR